MLNYDDFSEYLIEVGILELENLTYDKFQKYLKDYLLNERKRFEDLYELYRETDQYLSKDVVEDINNEYIQILSILDNQFGITDYDNEVHFQYLIYEF